MKAVVTGCAGFIGSHLVDTLLREGFSVTGVDCFTDYYPRQSKEHNIAGALGNKNFTLLEQDLLLLKKIPEADYIFHHAAQPGVRGSWGENFGIYVRNNILVTQKLLELSKESKIKKFVFASSSSVYGDAKLPMKEDARPVPLSPYGVTKLAAENLVNLYHKSYGVPVISLRYFTVYGPRQRPDMAINRFARGIIDGENIAVFGDGTQTRDFTYVDDVVRANLEAARSDLSGEIFNIGGGTRISVNDLVGKIEKIVGKSARVTHADRQKGDMRDTLADTSKAEKLLAWQPQVGIEEGLKRYIDWI